MRNISKLSRVELCGRETSFQFNELRFPGSRKARIALDRAVGWMHLDDWKKLKVGNPIPYFRSALTMISRNVTNAPGQETVEYVLQEVFFNHGHSGLSDTLNKLTMQEIHARLTDALRQRLGFTTGGSMVAITPGFEDMLPRNAPSSAGNPLPTVKPPGSGGGVMERCALEEALGVAFIDYFNGYSVDADLTQAFVGFGGTDINVGNALSVVFSAGFTKTLEGLVSGAPEGTKARYFMNALATSFGNALRVSVNTAGNPDLDPVFADLTILGL